MNRKYLFLLLILAIGFVLRFYKLGDVPFGLHRDEAFLGYNAYSILKTGRDLHGVLFPLHLKSFLYSPAGYSYFSIPFISIFGLSSFSVRFASAFFGTLTILVVFFLSKNIFQKKREGLFIAFLSSLFLAFSPWHINLSRTATENTVVVFFLSLGLLFYLEWIKNERNIFLLSSFLSFGLTLVVYQAPRAFLPLLLPFVMLFLLKRNEKKKVIKSYLLFILVIIVPLIFVLSSKELSLRVRTVSIFATQETQLTLDEQLRQDGVHKENIYITRAFHNKIISYSSLISENYFKHFSYEFLFTDHGFPDRYRVPLASPLYIFELPFLLLGVFFIVKRREKRELLILAWIFLAPIGSALTFDDIPNLQRTLLIFPALSMVIALGFFETFLLFSKRKKIFLPVCILFSLVVIYQINFYLHQYYVHYNYYRPWYRNDGYKALVEEVSKHMASYKKIIVTNRESAPTIFFLFHTRYNPAQFQEETKSFRDLDFDRLSFGKYEFSQEECPLKDLITGEKDVLYVNSGLCKNPSKTRVVMQIKRGDNSSVFYLLDIPF